MIIAPDPIPQNPSLVYTTSGTPTAALLSGPPAIVDEKLYEIPCATREEAYYLLGILNSTAIREAVAPLMSKGQYGARDMHKHVWRLPIPTYDDSDSIHRRMMATAKRVKEKATRLWQNTEENRRMNNRSTSNRIARKTIRAWLQTDEDARTIEVLVTQILA